jgi:hypothetical protein
MYVVYLRNIEKRINHGPRHHRTKKAACDYGVSEENVIIVVFKYFHFDIRLYSVDNMLSKHDTVAGCLSP